MAKHEKCQQKLALQEKKLAEYQQQEYWANIRKLGKKMFKQISKENDDFFARIAEKKRKEEAEKEARQKAE